MRTGQRESRGVVIESGASPVRRAVACSAGRGKARRGVGRTGSSIPIFGMAGIAVSGQCRVVVIHMA